MSASAQGTGDAMPHSEDYGIDDNDAEFIAAATQVESSTNAAAFDVSPRPTKRRRFNVTSPQNDVASSDSLAWLEDDNNSTSIRNQDTTQTEENRSDKDVPLATDPEYYFPCELGGEDRSTKKSRHKIHVPRHTGHLPNMIFTQTQVGLDFSASEIRGAIWKKPKPPSPPSYAIPKTNGTTPNGAGDALGHPLDHRRRSEQVAEDARLAARLQSGQNVSAHKFGPIRRSNSRVANDGACGIPDEFEDLPSDAFMSSYPETALEENIVITDLRRTASQNRAPGLRGPQKGLKQMTIFGQPATQDLTASQAAKKKPAWPLKSREDPPTHHALDHKALESWVYPTNLGSIRDYQFNIVSRSLFHNTLVALPTGLGKTFIAATVMLNYYRWTRSSQIVFMAPTKPLITQQMDACYHIVGIPRRDTVLMTGETSPALRANEWLRKRVFFMTPQTVINDLKTGICNPKMLVLLVVDEAHKATGGYAYTEVVAFVRRFNTSFRILALTATPGSTVEAVQAVINNLDIARVELRTEQSLDIRQYTHEKHTDTMLFDYCEEQQLIMEHMTKALRPAVDKLCSQNAYWSRDPMNLTAYGLTQSRQKWMGSDAGRKAPMPIKGMVNALFTDLSKLAHSIHLLKNHGIVPFYSKISDYQRAFEQGESKGKTAQSIVQNEDWQKMSKLVRSWTNNPDFIGHPKLQYLRDVVLNHFLDAGEGKHQSSAAPAATRVMVFASYRDSTEEICRVLKRSEPLIRPHVFVGQAGSKGSEGMSQKKQNEVVRDFKTGKYNTLVATSIGEEGLDIGDVDLIVCYDASSSPIRMLQRIGRTGRKRVGKVSLLLMRGKEENDYAKAKDNYAYIQKSMTDSSSYTFRTEHSSRILSPHMQPIVEKRMVEIPLENSQPIDLTETGRRSKGKGKKRPPKRFNMPDNVRTGFVRASKLESDHDSEEDDAGSKPRVKSKAGLKRKKTLSKAAERSKLPEPEPAQLPFLEDVLLNADQKAELTKKYCAHAGDAKAALMIDPERWPPTAIGTMGPTKNIPRGRAAEVILKLAKAMHEVDESRVAYMKSIFGETNLKTAGEAQIRLASPVSELSSIDSTSLRQAPMIEAKTISRPRKNQSTARISAPNSPVPVPIQRRCKNGRPRMRAASFASAAAAERDESSPGPAPTNLRLGTQGIDLGSRDTSGEDDDEEPDSELDAFIAKSDEIIEMFSSSPPLSQQAPALGKSSAKRAGKSLRRKTYLKDASAAIAGAERSEGEETLAGSDRERVPKSCGVRMRRVVESDSD